MDDKCLRALRRLIEAAVELDGLGECKRIPIPPDAPPWLRLALSEFNRVRGNPRVAYLGPPGSFSHEVVKKLFGGDADEVAEHSIRAVVSRLVEGSVDYAVVPVENSIEGPVGETLRALAENDVKIWLEYVHPVRLVLATRDSTRPRRVYGHPHALGEARSALEKLLGQDVELVPVASTSLAAMKASEEDGTACVCSELAARMYGLRVIAQGLTERPNFTRFLVLSWRDNPNNASKTSIVAAIPHEPGSLYRFLEPFAKHRVNLTMIYSYPVPGSPWHYYFFIDMEGSRLEDRISSALEEAASRAKWLKLLGSYPVVHGT